MHILPIFSISLLVANAGWLLETAWQLLHTRIGAKSKLERRGSSANPANLNVTSCVKVRIFTNLNVTYSETTQVDLQNPREAWFYDHLGGLKMTSDLCKYHPQNVTKELCRPQPQTDLRPHARQDGDVTSCIT